MSNATCTRFQIRRIMVTLRQQLWPIVKEYTRQMKELMDASEVHWIGTDDDGNAPAVVLDINGNYFFSFEEIQIIIDNLDKWVARYGSREAVAQEIRDWQDWWLGENDTKPSCAALDVMEVWENRRDRYINLRPRINLKHWLLGCPREKRDPNDHDRLRELRVKRELVVELSHTYRGSRSLWNIVDNLSADIKVCEERIKEADTKIKAEMKHNEKVQQFLDELDEITKEEASQTY